MLLKGFAALENVDRMKQEAGLMDNQWGNFFIEASGTNLQAVLNAYKDTALSNEFVRSIAFQLIYTLGVGRFAMGLHHNDLLTLTNIRLTQVIHAPSPIDPLCPLLFLTFSFLSLSFCFNLHEPQSP